MSEKIETGGPAYPHTLRGHPIETGMTLRQYAAIKLRVPSSGTDWLDEMIRQSLRDELAGKAMQGLVAGDLRPDVTDDEITEVSYGLADAMLKAREVKNGQG